MINLIYVFLTTIIEQMSIPCVNYNDNCYSQPCCEPYICYEETVCINNITHS